MILRSKKQASVRLTLPAGNQLRFFNYEAHISDELYEDIGASYIQGLLDTGMYTLVEGNYDFPTLNNKSVKKVQEDITEVEETVSEEEGNGDEVVEEENTKEEEVKEEKVEEKPKTTKKSGKSGKRGKK